MVEPTSGRIALLSIHPEYARALVEGVKRVEFRKRRLADDISFIAVYATRPVSRVVGLFSIDDQVIASPDDLWNEFEQVAGITRDKFVTYFQDTGQGAGIRVREFAALSSPLPLESAFGVTRPPQSCQYFRPDQASGEIAGIVTQLAR